MGLTQMTDEPDELLPELLEIWRRLDKTPRTSLIRVACALAEAAPERGGPSTQVIKQDGGGWGVG
jgi:hypothetical protein